MNNKLEINTKLHKDLPRLSNEEFSLLEQKILTEGFRDPIVTWKNIIVDGRHRYEICQKNNITFTTSSISLNNEDEARIWIINNQLAKRNLTDGTRYILISDKKNILEKVGKENMSVGGKVKGLSTIDKPSHNTQKIISNDLGWSTGKVAIADVVWQEADDKDKEEIIKGNKSFNEVYTVIKKEKKSKQLEKKKQEILKASKIAVKDKIRPKLLQDNAVDFLQTLNDNSLSLIITDPPYSTDVENIQSFVNEWLPLAIQKVKPDGRMYVCTGAYPIEIQAYLNVLLSQNKFIVDNPLIWTYRNTLGVTPKMKYNLNYQMIWHLYSETSKPLDTSITNEMFSVQDINAPDGRLGNRFHTWQKPDELARRLIAHSTQVSDLVVDPFCGTGTFLIEAAKLDRGAMGCDVNVEMLKIASQRGCSI